MADRRKKAPVERVVRRAAGTKSVGLPPEIDALARGEVDRLRRPPPGPRLNDPRASALIPGVANRDARSLCDRRVAELRELIEAGAEEAIERALAEAVMLRIWRGRSMTSLGAWSEELLELSEVEAVQKASAGCATLGLESISDEAIALWLRAEVALVDAGLLGPSPSGPDEPRAVSSAHGSMVESRPNDTRPRAPRAQGEVTRRAMLSVRATPESLVLELPVGVAARALTSIGQRLAPLARDQREHEDRPRRPRR